MGTKPSPSNRALYRAYRSQAFEEVVGQTHITDTLSAAVTAGKTTHAYLFTGPHGVGKTTVARILAHAINQLPYDGQSNHLDIIEIDAASNRGIDEVRELRERAFVAPSSARYKVYIIDEVHMLTTPAFNALLKLLEEPPGHVVFILATTEAHKVPATIRSRAQWHAFNPISPKLVNAHLSFIAQREGIVIEPQAIELLSAHGRGSLRDSIGLLEQLASGGQSLSAEYAANMLGLAPTELVGRLIEAVQIGDWRAVKDQSQTAQENGASAKQLAQQLIDGLTQLTPDLAILTLIERLLSVSQAADPWLMLRVVLLSEAVQARPIDKPNEVTSSAETLATTEPTRNDNSSSSKASPTELKPAQWQAVLSEVKARNNSLYAILRMAEPSLNQDNLQLRFGFDFHKQRLSEDRNRQLVKQVVAAQLGREVAVSSVVDKGVADRPGRSENPLLDVIQVMGGGVSVDYDEGEA